MASASSSPPHNHDPFDLGPRTPSGLARGARVALLRNSPATREGEIGVSRSALRTAYTPSSPLHAVSYAAATEGAQRAVHFDSSEPDPQSGDGPVSIANAADKLVVAQNEEPWTQVRGSRCLTKTHPAYDTYSPVSTWEDIDTRPRVMTYIRRGARLLADQQRPALSRDILWLVVNGVTLVNVYREPNLDTALEVLFAWPIPSQCIIAGDFNARHHTWQIGPSRGHGGIIAEWAAENDLDLLNPINTPTNAHGNTIDLAFSNIPLAEATVEDHLATSSDHFTLSISLPALKPATLPPGKILLASDEELKRFTELVVSGATIIPQAATTAADLDRLADAIIDLIQSAARAAGRRSQRRPRKAPWWNEECAASVAELRCVRRAFPLGFNRDVQLARRDLRRVVRRAKRAYWRELIDGVRSDKDVFKITRWLKRPGVFRPPPLQVGETIIETQIGKAEALRHATLERRTADDDISDPWTPRTTLPFFLFVLFLYVFNGWSRSSEGRASALHPAEALHSGCEAQPLRKSLPRPIKKMGDDSDATSHATLHPADGCEAPTKERLEPMRC
ncbi:hypothetical protein PCL_08414 [Purpureocillium lilacinum]|uniref:Endonuclease/exonuclease/phosphatase domain-containing protein n=1 Tax=Purpureocillium lilacinum TaxID=33203 RepID=A0A2U3DRT2_PURLI|nr:hypothetical protein PCL_08414 [Purpureocillium lilacinum]